MTSSAPEPDTKALLAAVEDIARRAGAEIMKYYNPADDAHQANVEIKQDGSEVTAADKASEAIILPALRALAPGIPIVSEEDFAGGARADISGGTFWTVDPLDGTKEFINRTGAFVVAIGLVIDNKAALGVIYHPALGLLYSGAGAGTATKVDDKDNKRTPIGGNVKAAESKKINVLVNEPHANMPHIKGYLSEQFGKAAKIDPKSGILRACRVAEGLADMSVYEGKNHGGRTAWWDIAPGHAIIEAAGGKVEKLDDKGPLLYNDADYRVPAHAAFSPQRAKALAARPAPDNKPK